MGLDCFLTGRKVIGGFDDKRQEDGYNVHAVELNLWHNCGWEWQPLCDWFAENLHSSGHAGYPADGSFYFLDEDNLDKVAAAVEGDEVAWEKNEGDPRRPKPPTKAEIEVLVAALRTASTWLGNGGDKVYFEVNC